MPPTAQLDQQNQLAALFTYRCWYGVDTDANGRVTEPLTDNSLSGTIPADVGNLASLTTLNLRDNGLTGCVPKTLQSIAAIQDDLTSLGLPRCDADLAALTALYEATNGANWTNRTNWLTDQPLG